MAVEEDRRIIEDALSRTAIAEQEPRLAGAFVSGWVTVVEHMDTGGQRWMTVLTSDGLTQWGRDGMLHSALYGGND